MQFVHTQASRVTHYIALHLFTAVQITNLNPFDKLFLCAKARIGQIHYDPLMMQQKEARRKHTWVLPKKVAFLVRVPDSALYITVK